MWFFRAPQVVFGEDALSYLGQVQGRRAFVVTDVNLQRLGFPDRVRGHLAEAGVECEVFAAVEPEPSLETVRRGAEAMATYGPNWVVGLGGGSAIDAAKAMWILYERPDLDPAGISPLVPLGLRAKARLIAIPTTSGTGSEATWATVLTDPVQRRKLGLASPEIVPDIAIVDPSLAANLPPSITADTGVDVLSHAVEAYACTWHNDFSDGLALKAIDLVFRYLPRAYVHGAADMEARERMHNAAGIAFGNASTGLAHALGHALGACFHVPHGRGVGLCLPYTVEYSVRGDSPTRYAEIARFLGLRADDEVEGAANLVRAIRDLQQRLALPQSVRETGVKEADYRAEGDRLVLLVEGDTQVIMASRIPDRGDTARLLEYAYDGRSVDF